MKNRTIYGAAKKRAAPMEIKTLYNNFQSKNMKSTSSKVNALRFLGAEYFANITGRDARDFRRQLVIRRELNSGCRLLIGPWFGADACLKRFSLKMCDTDKVNNDRTTAVVRKRKYS
jgi:hypothetical protein